MKRTYQTYLFALLFCTMSALLCLSCGGSHEAEEAAARVEQARTLIRQGNLEGAKQELDSVHILFRQQVDARREAKSLQDTIARLEAERNAHYADSVLQLLLPQVDPLLKHFRYDKDDKYEDNGHYVSRLLRTEQNSERCFLQAYVGDNRITTLKSYYCGKAQLCQTKLEISAMNSDVHDSRTGREHHFSPDAEEADGFHSILTIEDQDAIDLLAFITIHQRERLRVRLHGNTTTGKEVSPYVYFLSDNDKKALVETLQLATLFHDINQMEQVLNNAQRQIERLNRKDLK